MYEVMHVMYVLMQKSDWVFGIGLPFSKVMSFLETNGDCICFYEDASKVDFGLSGNRKYGLDYWLVEGSDFPKLGS